MKYSIETTDKGCVETLEIGEEKFQRESIRTEYGCSSSNPDFEEQLAKSGYCDEILEKVYDLYDGCEALDFLELAELITEVN